MDGNYSRHLTERLARASSAIWLAVPVPVCVWRYLRRCLSKGQRRDGGLDGGSERFKWHMLRHIVLVQPGKAPIMERLVAESGKPLIRLSAADRIEAAYAKWGLDPHDPSRQ